MSASVTAPSPVREELAVELLIVGAGPTGLGAAARLEQLGCNSWLLTEGSCAAGGLSATVTTPEGFMFDLGGHVLFSHFEWFDELLDHAVGRGDEHWVRHRRVSNVRHRGVRVPYPFQLNLASLPPDDKAACVLGLVRAHAAAEVRAAKGEPAAGGAAVRPRLARYSAAKVNAVQTFDEWALQQFGEGIANAFTRPYNLKVWGVRTTMLSAKWVAERVATESPLRCIERAVRGDASSSWGPNATFRFPRRGGTGSVWTAVANQLPRHRLAFGCWLTGVDAHHRVAHFGAHRSVRYRHMLCTAPLDDTLRLVGRHDLADRLTCTATHIIGLGMRGHATDDSACWEYFPDLACPFYRATSFSRYSAAHVPASDKLLPTLRLPSLGAESAADPPHSLPAGAAAPAPGPYWSLLLEVCESVARPARADPVVLALPLDGSAAGRLGASAAPVRELERSPDGAVVGPGVVEDAVRGAVAAGLLPGDAQIVTLCYRYLPRGYPVPTLQRDLVVTEALNVLEEAGISSRGRFGAWMYEVSNQDHSCMQGAEWADRMVGTRGGEEPTLRACVPGLRTRATTREHDMQ